ncbi:MAG: tyrosine--tRNA ligase [Phycisphaerales bacterium]
MTGFIEELRWRGLIHQITAEDHLARWISTPGRVAYAGFDPTADSLTIGNLVPLMLLQHWQRAGHVPVALAGGATGLIGDPSGKDEERSLRSREEIEANIAGQRRVYDRVLDFDPARPNAARLVNNIDWFESIGFIHMLREVGKHFSVNEMIRKDSVRTRLEGREQGISYTEFSYMLLQAYDFLHLFRTHECRVQMAGSDQYGNIVSGIDLIRREQSAARGDVEADAPDAFGFTAPLITRADGQKIGKTADGAIWLTADRTSPYRFFQYWINVADEDVASQLRIFTFMAQDEIDALLTAHAAAPHERAAQRALARSVTEMIHGPSERQLAEDASEALFSGDVATLDARQLAAVAAEVPSSEHPTADLAGDGLKLLELLPATSLASSKRQAREFLGSGAVSVNGRKVEGVDATLASSDVLDGGLTLLRRGRRAWHAIRWTSKS